MKISKKKKDILSDLFSDENNNSLIKLTINEYELIIDFITSFSDFFTTEILNTKSLNFLEKEKKINFYILRPLISLISYPIIDRSVRLLKLIDNHKKIDELEINNYLLNDYFISRADFYANVRDNKELNEFIISNILKKEFSKSKKLNLIKHYNWSAWEGEEENSAKKFLNFIRYVFQKKKWYLKNKLNSKKQNYFEDDIIVKNITYGSYFFEKNFKNIKNFDKIIDHNVYRILNGVKYDNALRTNLSNELDKTFSLKIKELFKQLNLLEIFNNHIDTKKYLNLFFKLMPISVLEGSNKLLEFVKENHFKNTKIYIDGFVGGLEISSAISGFLKSKGVVICGIQHSGRGGYLANTPNIAEVSILNTDYYITAGWKNEEKKLPIPLKDYIPLPSPNPNYKINVHKFKNNKTALFSLGMWFKYPVMYDSAYYNENFIDLLDFIENSMRLMSNHDLKIITRLYCPASKKIVTNFLNRIGSIKNVEIIDDIKKGSSPKYFKLSDVALWDIPAGGFLECLNQGIPTVAIGNKNFMRFQEGSKEIINKMFDEKLLVNTPEEMCEITKNILLNKIININERQEIINSFLSNYGWSENEKKSVNYYNNFFNKIINK